MTRTFKEELSLGIVGFIDFMMIEDGSEINRCLKDNAITRLNQLSAI